MVKTIHYDVKFFLAFACLCWTLQLNATVHSINVANTSFSPSSISSVMVGDTVRWIWVSGSHTTTSVSIPAGAATWDQPMNSTNTQFDYKVTVAGSYNFQCTPHSGMMTGSFTATDNTTNINSLKPFLKEVKIYPNPFNSELTIDRNGTGYNQAVLTDVLGRFIFEVELLQQPAVINEPFFKISSLPEGLYFLTLTGLTEEKQTVRIVKTTK